MPKVFISYRRQDSEYITGRLYEHIVQRLGKSNVFMDIDTIPLGADFRVAVQDAVAKCDACLVVIGPGWIEATTEGGERRLSHQDDLVRMEIEAALERSIPVIPVLVNRARIPRPDELPASLAELSYCNGLALRPDPDFRRDIESLMQTLVPLSEKREDAAAATSKAQSSGLNTEWHGDIALVRFNSSAPSRAAIRRLKVEFGSLIAREKCRKLVINLANLKTLDNDLLGLLVSVLDAIQKLDGRLKLCDIGPLAFQMLRLAKLHYHFEIADDLDSALSDW